jgi:hypothetical protein
MKYPKLAAAIDDFLAKAVQENGELLVELALTKLAEAASSTEGATKEHLPAIPVTKELVLSEQTEVRNGD